MKVTAFILSYNKKEALIECIQSLTKQSCISEIIVLENFSAIDLTETYNYLNECYANSSEINFKIDYAEKPLSFAEAQNWAMDEAENEYILAISNDAYILETDSLKTSLSLMQKDDNVFIVGHKIIESNGKLNHFGVFQLFYNNDPAHFGINRDPDDCEFLNVKSCLAVTAACILFKKSQIKFDTDYWFEFEDVDFCFQHYIQGHKILVNPECVVVHDEATTRGAKKKDEIWVNKQEAGLKHYYKKWGHKFNAFRLISFQDNLLGNKKVRRLCLSKLGDFIGFVIAAVALLLLFISVSLVWIVPVIFITVKLITLLSGEVYVYLFRKSKSNYLKCQKI